MVVAVCGSLGRPVNALKTLEVLARGRVKLEGDEEELSLYVGAIHAPK